MTTGRLFEWEVLKDGVDIMSNREHVKYKTYYSAMKEVVRQAHKTGWDVTDPESRVANDLHANVAEELGIDDYDKLEFYPAVGSNFDIFHGVDCFFVYEGKVVTIDLSIRNKQTFKADLLITPEMLEGDMSEIKKDISNHLQYGGNYIYK